MDNSALASDDRSGERVLVVSRAGKMPLMTRC